MIKYQDSVNQIKYGHQAVDRLRFYRARVDNIDAYIEMTYWLNVEIARLADHIARHTAAFKRKAA